MHDRPWMTALEMQFVAVRNARLMVELIKNPPKGVLPPGTPWDPNIKEHQRLASSHASRYLPKAQPYSWAPDITTAVLLASKTIPDSATLSGDTLPGTLSWWWFETPIRVKQLSDGPDRLIDLKVIDPNFVSGLMIADGYVDKEENIEVVVFFKGEDGPYCQIVVSFPARIPIGELSVHHRQLARFVAAACAWLQQRIISTSTRPVERHRRKQLAREYDATISDVKVIELRRFEPPPHDPTTAHEHVEWSCRWIVGGHWRNQPYKDAHRLIYIMPFVKGPADKPLRVPSHTVYRVDR